MCARPFSMLWHGRKSGAATLTRSCARWSCCPCLALALEVWAKMVCSSDLFPDDFQLLQLKTWKNTFSSLSLYMFLCQMVLLSMSFPCSWCLAPDGGVATFFPDVLDLHWLAHLKILEMDPFLAKFSSRTRSCVRWSCCQCLVHVLNVWAKFACSSHSCVWIFNWFKLLP